MKESPIFTSKTSCALLNVSEPFPRRAEIDFNFLARISALPPSIVASPAEPPPHPLSKSHPTIFHIPTYNHAPHPQTPRSKPKSPLCTILKTNRSNQTNSKRNPRRPLRPRGVDPPLPPPQTTMKTPPRLRWRWRKTVWKWAPLRAVAAASTTRW